MQQFKVYTIKDSKGANYMSPFLKISHGLAERTFLDLKKEPKHPINEYPQDFDLYYLGEFDDSTGKFKLLDSPQHMLKASDLNDRTV